MRINIERETKLRQKQDEELKSLKDRPDIPSLAKYSSRINKRGINSSAVIEEAGGESAIKKQRTYRSPEVAGANDKWDWLYKVGVKKVMEQKKAGREQDLIIFEREKEEYTFHPNKAIAKKGDESLISRNQQIASLTRARTYQAPIPQKNVSISTKGPKPSATS